MSKTNKEDFIHIARENITRCGIEDLLVYLESTDFFDAPASTKYHGSYAGGLVDHSINVFYCLLDELKFIYMGDSWKKVYTPESAAIVSLFHDLCKINRYKKIVRNVKNEFGVWEQVPGFAYNDESYLCMGHATSSLHTLTKFIQLTDEEAQAIYWHMGAFDISQYSTIGQCSEAFSGNTLAFALHRADMMATHIVENEKFSIQTEFKPKNSEKV